MVNMSVNCTLFSKPLMKSTSSKPPSVRMPLATRTSEIDAGGPARRPSMASVLLVPSTVEPLMVIVPGEAPGAMVVALPLVAVSGASMVPVPRRAPPLRLKAEVSIGRPAREDRGDAGRDHFAYERLRRRCRWSSPWCCPPRGWCRCWCRLQQW